jgi:hypothetical protein
MYASARRHFQAAAKGIDAKPEVQLRTLFGAAQAEGRLERSE